MAAAAAVLRIALDHLHQPEKFESYWDYLQSEWLTTSDDLRVASEREEYWNSLKLPLRLKIELVKVMESYETNVDPVDYSIESTSRPDRTATTATTTGGTTTALTNANTNNNTVTANTDANPTTNNDSDWELYYCEEQQAYYYYNSVTGESQWAEYDENAELIAEYNAANLTYQQQQEEGQQEGYYEERMFQRPRRLTSNRQVLNQNNTHNHDKKKNKNKKDPRVGETDTLPIRHSRKEKNRLYEKERKQVPREDNSDHDDDNVASEASTVNSFEDDDSSSEGSVNYIITEKSNGRRFKVEAYKIKADQAEEEERDFLSAPKECFLPLPSAPPNDHEWPPQAPYPMPRRIEEKVTPTSSPVLGYPRRAPLMDYDRTSIGGNETTSYNEADLLSMALSPSSPQVTRGYVEEPPIATAEAFPLVPSELTTFDPPPPNQIATHVKPPANHSVAAGESKLHRLLRKVNIFGKPPAAPPPALNEQQQRRALKEANIRTLCEMGFSRKTATYALQLAGGNLEDAMAMLLESTDENK
eukprot:scaffold386_cov174-Ochromonas_danica.AAC.1